MPRGMMGVILCLLIISGTGAWADTLPRQGKQVVLSAMDQWPPYTDTGMPGSGLFSEICTRAFSRRGYTVTIKFLPWKRALEMTRRGLFHGLIGASLTRDREKDFAYPRNYLFCATHFFTAGATPLTFSAMRDLCPAKVGVLQGSIWVKNVSAHKCFTVEPVPSYEQNIQKLIRGRIDLVIGTKAAFLFHLNRSFPQNAARVKAVYPPVKLDRIFTVFSRQTPGCQRLINEYDMGIEMLRSDGTYGDLLKKYGIEEPALTRPGPPG
ncbi:MAG: transporter substrate-binding domain-containing protein [Desulfobacter sp.]|nr:MAG: transporter substrate-binding domain-containing protein [Desulfobacter sp.]